MSESVTVTKKISDGLHGLETQETITGGSLVKINEAFAEGNTVITVSIDVSAIQAIMIKADQDCTLTPNAGTALSVTADAAIIWTSTDPAAGKPFDADLTSITVGAAVAGTLEMWVLTDPTPA